MPDVRKTIEERVVKYRKDFAPSTSEQMKSQVDQPKGIMSSKAYDIVVLEKIAEEHVVRRKAALLAFFPSITDLQLAGIDLEDEGNDGGGLVIRQKPEVEDAK